MTTPDDVLESGSATHVPREWPRALDQVPLVVAALGGVAAVISMIKPWQVTTIDSPLLRGPDDKPLVMTSTLYAGGTLGTAYVVALIALVAAIVLTLRGSPSVRPTARLIGLGLAGSAIAVAGVLIFAFGDVTSGSLGYFGGFDLPAEAVKAEIKLGTLAGLAAPVLGGIALWLANPDRAPHQPLAEDDYIDSDDEPRYGEGIEVIGLTVRAG